MGFPMMGNSTDRGLACLVGVGGSVVSILFPRESCCDEALVKLLASVAETLTRLVVVVVIVVTAVVAENTVDRVALVLGPFTVLRSISMEMAAILFVFFLSCLFTLGILLLVPSSGLLEMLVAAVVVVTAMFTLATGMGLFFTLW